MNTNNQSNPQNINKPHSTDTQKEFSDGQSSYSDFHPKKILSNKKNKNSKKKGKRSAKCQLTNDSFWTLPQNVLYKQFLIEYGELFNLSREQRRKIKINVLMSRKVKSRTSDQCRSHHQKMIKYHHSLPNIIHHILRLENNGGAKYEKVKGEEQMGCSLIEERLLDWEQMQRQVQSYGEQKHLFYFFLKEDSFIM